MGAVPISPGADPWPSFAPDTYSMTMGADQRRGHRSCQMFARSGKLWRSGTRTGFGGVDVTRLMETFLGHLGARVVVTMGPPGEVGCYRDDAASTVTAQRRHAARDPGIAPAGVTRRWRSRIAPIASAEAILATRSHRWSDVTKLARRGAFCTWVATCRPPGRGHRVPTVRLCPSTGHRKPRPL